MITAPMRADIDDYKSIIELTEECFPRDKELGGMVPRWGHCFRRDLIQNSLVIKDGGEVVSHVGCIDQSVMVGSRSIRVSGISSVSTRPSHRGRGFMTKLLNRSIEFMKDQGYVLSDLGGDRLRYRRFGWELAGRNCRYRITRRSLSPHSKPQGIEVREFSDTNRESVDTLALHHHDGFGLVRDRVLHDILLHRLGKVTLVAWRDDVIEAYGVVNLENEKSIGIDELAGEEAGICGIIQSLMQRGPEEIVVRMPYRHPLNKPMRTLSSGWIIEPWRMLKILDLMGLLEGFSKQIESRISRPNPCIGESVHLCIKGEQNTVEISFDSDGVRLESADRSGDAICLSEQDMVLLLFGPCNPELHSTLPGPMRAHLPLDFYLWKNEVV